MVYFYVKFFFEKFCELVGDVVFYIDENFIFEEFFYFWFEWIDLVEVE